MKVSLAILMLWIAFAAPAGLRAQAGDLDRQAVQLQEQGPALQAFLKRSREGQVDPQFTAEVLNRAKALEDQGLPAEPYLLKANEGLAKRVPPKQMAPALEATTARTRSAAALADEAMKRGATASPQARRQAILQFQSELMAGRSQGDLEKAIQAGFSKGRKPSLTDLAEEVAQPGRGKKEKSKAPAPPTLEHSPGSEKPAKAVAPAKVKREKSSPGMEKGGGKPKGGDFEKSGYSKPSSSPTNHGNSKGKQGGKGRGK
jgi:hypothetical protein